MSTGQLFDRIEELRLELQDALALIEELKTENEQLEDKVWDLTHEEEVVTTNH